MGPVRDGDGMQFLIRELEQLKKLPFEEMTIGDEDSTYNRDRLEAIELPLMIQTALLVTQAGLCREESRGSHYRSDFQETDDTVWRRNIVLQKSGPADTTVRIERIVQEP